MRRLPPPPRVTSPRPSRTTRRLVLTTFAVRFISIRTGSGPQRKRMSPPRATARTTAREVQLPGVPLPTQRSGREVFTARASRGTSTGPGARASITASPPITRRGYDRDRDRHPAAVPAAVPRRGPRRVRRLPQPPGRGALPVWDPSFSIADAEARRPRRPAGERRGGGDLRAGAPGNRAGHRGAEGHD